MRAEHNWEEHIRKQLREHTEAPPPMAWERISQDIRPKRRRRWRWLVAFLPLLLSVPFVLQVQQPALHELSSAAPHPKPKQPAVPEAGSAAAGSATAIRGQMGAAEIPETKQTSPDRPEPDMSKPAAAIHTRSAVEKEDERARLIVLPGRQKQPVAVVQERFPEKRFETTVPETESTQQPDYQPFSAKMAKSLKAAGAGITLPSASDAATLKPADTPGQENLAGHVPQANRQASEQVQQGMHSGEGILETAAATSENRSDASAEPQVAAVDAVAAMAQTENQEEEQEKAAARNRKWQYSLLLTPQYLVQRVLPNTTDAIYLQKTDSRKGLERERLNYDISLRVGYALSEQVSLEAGITFAYLKQVLHLRYQHATADSLVLRQENGQLHGQVYQRQANAEYRSAFYFGGAYAGLAFNLEQKIHLPLLVSAGGGLNWILKEDLHPDDVAALVKPAAKPYFRVALQLRQPLSPGVALQAGPTMQYYLSDFQQENALVTTRPILWGMQLGLVFGAQPEK